MEEVLEKRWVGLWRRRERLRREVGRRVMINGFGISLSELASLVVVKIDHEQASTRLEALCAHELPCITSVYGQRKVSISTVACSTLDLCLNRSSN